MKIARIYLRVSTDEQDLTRQTEIAQSTRTAGYYVAGVYREKASGARADRPELLRMIADLQPGEVVVAEKIDRISRLPLAEAEKLVASIRSKGAKLAVPGLVDLSDLAAETDGVARIVLESVQELLLKLALQMARDDYETRRERQRQATRHVQRALAPLLRHRREDVLGARRGEQSLDVERQLVPPVRALAVGSRQVGRRPLAGEIVGLRTGEQRAGAGEERVDGGGERVGRRRGEVGRLSDQAVLGQ